MRPDQPTGALGRRRRRKLTGAVVIALAAALVTALPAPSVSAAPEPAVTTESETEDPDGTDGGDDADEDARMTLWYDEPATSWENQSLPIGSGALGASVFGGTGSEKLTLNEKSLWTGGPGSPGYNFGNWTTPRPTALADVQARINAETQVSPNWVATQLGQAKTGFGSYQVFGDLTLDGLPSAGASEYRRSLNIADALAAVQYTSAGVGYSREYFASYPGGVIAGRLSADQPGKLGFTAKLTTATNRSRTATATAGRITMAGALTDNRMKYESQLQVINHGGTRTDNADGSVTVAGADSVELFLAAGTDYAFEYPTYRGADPHAGVTSRVDAAVAKGYQSVRAEHLTDYRNLHSRMKLDLNQEMPAIPTDDLLKAYSDGSASAGAKRALEALYFQFGRYLLISSSRAGSLPANLQGVWNNSTSPPWSADYHVNINLQMNYWPAQVTNLAETTEPLFDYVDAMVAPGQVSAQQIFGARGWTVGNETNPFGFTGLHNFSTSFWFPEAGAWLARAYWENYQFTRDESFLRERAYPMLKSLSQFWIDTLVVDPRDGKLVVSPSFSPEQGQFSAGAAMSEQIVWDLLTNTTAAAKIVGDDDQAFAGELAATLGNLDPGLRIGSWGQLQEWKTDWDVKGNDHRHVSHLYSLYPGQQIQPGRDDAFIEAAETSLLSRGDGGTGWSKAWKINFWARLLDGDHAHKMLSEQLTGSTLPNLWDTHPPFQIDGNFGATAGVAEMLLQSQRDSIDVLPALPAAWADGTVSGLKARGDVTVGATWSGGQARSITLAPAADGVLKVSNSALAGPIAIRDSAGATVEFTRDGSVASFTGRAGQTYRIDSLVNITVSAPDRVEGGADFLTEVTVGATSGAVPASTLKLNLPAGWVADPATFDVPELAAGQNRTYSFYVTPVANAATTQRIEALWSGADWSLTGVTSVTTSAQLPCVPAPNIGPLLAWDPTSGQTVTDSSIYGRNGAVTNGTGTYDASAPTGSGLVLNGNTYLKSANTSFGYLNEATFAAEVRIDGSGSYRRLFDWQPAGNSGTDGVLIDVTPGNNIRFIGAGAGTTTSAVLPTGKYVNLVVTMTDAGVLTVYVDGVEKSRNTISPDGINGCGSRPFQFAANQNGSERLTGQVDRVAVLARALPAAEVGNWQNLAFNAPAAADVTAKVTGQSRQGWFRAGPVLEITAQANKAVGIEYKLGSGGWTAYPAPVTLPEGVYEIGYRATYSGQTLDEGTLPARVDGTAPLVTANLAGRSVTLAATDAGSGVTTVEYSLDGGPWVGYSQPVALDAAAHSLAYRATDRAGNTSVSATLAVPAAGAALDVTAVAGGRCVAGKAMPTITVTNNEDVPVKVVVTTPFSTKSFASIVPGSNGFHAFTSRLVTVPAGSVTVEASATIDGKPVSVTASAPYGAIACG